MFLEVENDEYMLKARTIFFWSWNSWEHFESNDDIWCSLVVFQMMFLKMELLRKTFKPRTQNGAFWRYLKRFLGSWNCWEILKARRKNSAFWCYLKRCFGSSNCLANFESKKAKWRIRYLPQGHNFISTLWLWSTDEYVNFWFWAEVHL